MEGGTLAPGAVTWPMRPQATAAPFEDSKAAAVPRRYLRGRELHASNGEVRGTEEENVLRSPGRTSNDRHRWPGHHFPHTLRPPCPPRPSGVPERRRATGAGVGLGTCRDGQSRAASVRGRQDEIRAGPCWAVRGLRPRCLAPALLPVLPWTGWGPLTGAAQLTDFSPAIPPGRWVGASRPQLLAPIGLLQPPASYLEEGRDRGLAGGRSRAPSPVRDSCLGLPASPECWCL